LTLGGGTNSTKGRPLLSSSSTEGEDVNCESAAERPFADEGSTKGESEISEWIGKSIY